MKRSSYLCHSCEKQRKFNADIFPLCCGLVMEELSTLAAKALKEKGIQELKLSLGTKTTPKGGGG